MENLMSIRKQAGVMLVTLLFAGAALAQTPDVKPERIRGDIVSLQGDILTVHRRSGDTVSIEVKPDLGVSALKAVSLADVKAGSYVGAAAIAGSDGKMTASFPAGLSRRSTRYKRGALSLRFWCQQYDDERERRHDCHSQQRSRAQALL